MRFGAKWKASPATPSPRATPASYAVESYQSLFLKVHFPLEYMCACINNFGGFYRTEFYVHEARMLGARIEAPCVNTVGALAVADPTSQTLTLGFNLVKDLNHATVASLERDHGPKAGPSPPWSTSSSGSRRRSSS